MAAPVLLVEFTTDDPDDTTPTWVDVTEHVRAFSTNRGRDSELSLVEAGTATITLSNRDRDFDPVSDPTLRPMNRWRISAVMDGPVTEEIFLGYAESYDQQWPATGKDAVTVVSCVDEFKVLALDKLPATDPPRGAYGELIDYDGPTGVWSLRHQDLSWSLPADRGPAIQPVNGAVHVSASPIVGIDITQTYNSLATFGTLYYTTAPLAEGEPSVVSSMDAFAFETWLFVQNGHPASQETLIDGPRAAGTWTYRFMFNTDGTVTLEAKNNATTNHTVTSTTALANDTWYHLLGTITDNELRLYINGVEEAATAWTGNFGTLDSGAALRFGNLGGDIGSGVGPRFRHFAWLAFYPFGLTAARIASHYTAGRERGFARSQEPGDRVDAVLDAAGNTAGRNVQTGTRDMTGSYMTAQPPLDELRKAEQAENVDAVLFVAKDGTVTFLADGHRAAAPYDTVQATFDDEGNHLPYQGIDVDYSEAFLFNEWRVTRTGGTTTTATDATSVTTYKSRPRSLTDLPITEEADQVEIADALLAKYKDPLFRITGLDLLATETVAEAVLPLDLGHRIRVLRLPPGAAPLYPSTSLFPSTTLYPAAGPIDQTSFIQRIAVSGRPGAPWAIQLGVSPI